MTGGDDGIAHFKPFEHFNLAGLADTQFDRHTLRHQRIRFVTRDHFDHKTAAPLRHDGFFGNDHGLVALAEHRIHAGEHARTQLLLTVVDAPPHTHRPAIGIDQRVHGLHRGSKGTAWQRIDRELRFLTGPDLGLKALWQTEVHQHRVGVFDVDHVGTVFEVVAHVDLAQTGDPVERGHDLQSLQSGLGQRQLGLRDLQAGTTFVE